MELAARSFIVSSMRFAPDELFDTVCQDLIGERTLNQVSQDLGMNSAIRVYTPGRFTLFQFYSLQSVNMAELTLTLKAYEVNPC